MKRNNPEDSGSKPLRNASEKVTVKQSHYRPEQAQRVPGFKVPRFRDNGTGWWYVVSPTHRPPLPPGNAPGTYFC